MQIKKKTLSLQKFFLEKKIMKNEKIRFLIYAVILLIAVVLVSQTLFMTVLEAKDFPLRILCIFFVWAATCASHLWVITTVRKKPKAFTRVFMLQTALKLALYMASIIGYMFFFKKNAEIFTINFLFVYLIFSIFEVSLILKFVKKAKT